MGSPDKNDSTFETARSEGSLNERFVLFPNGQVYLCCMDYSLDHYIGNLFVSTYSYITDGTSPQSFNTVKTLLDSEEGKIICRRCEFANNKN